MEKNQNQGEELLTCIKMRMPLQREIKNYKNRYSIPKSIKLNQFDIKLDYSYTKYVHLYVTIILNFKFKK